MRARHLIAAIALAGAALFGMAPAQALPLPIVWDFDLPAGDNGLTHTYLSNPTLTPAENIIATAFSPGNTAHLFGKNDGGDEEGLGLTNDTTGDHEITPGSFVQLDLAALSDPPLTSVSFSFQTGSTTTPDVWGVYGSNTAGVLGTQLLTGSNDTPTTINNILGTWRYVNVTAITGNVLLRELDNHFEPLPVPEPATILLFASGLIGLGLVRRRGQT